MNTGIWRMNLNMKVNAATVDKPWMNSVLQKMGFGTELQQKDSHEALLRLQDAEIRLLENIRRCFTLRIKSDKEYASALNAVCSCAQKFENSEFSSPIFDAWNLIVRETQNLSNVLKTRAEALSVNPMEKLALLISEKKLARKLYYDERNRLDFEIYRLHEEVNRNRTEYERMMDKLKVDRVKYEEMMSRGKVGNKLDEAKSRYLKTTSKLHKLHNDYVLSIRDFSIQQKNMHTVILPNLLDYHHKIQESLVKQCKDVLEEYVRLTDLSYVDIISAHKNMAEVLGSIQPATEYDKFLDEYRSDPLKEEVMEFDGELLEDYQGNLVPDAIAFNDLTVSHLNQSRTAYETKISSCKTRIESKEKDLANVEGEIAQLPHTNDLSDEQKSSLLVKQRQALILKREISELDCHMQKYEQLLTIVKTAIESSGDHDPPAGLTFDVPQNERRNSRNDIQETQSMNDGPSSTTFKRKFPNIKNPFGKRSTRKLKSFFKPMKIHPDKRHCTFESCGLLLNLMTAVFELVHETLYPPPAPSAPPKPPSRDEIETLRYENHDDDDDPGPISSKDVNPCRKIEDEEWFHGVLPREEVQRLLTNDGDFLVRESRNRTSGEPQSVLSVMWRGHKHFIIQGGEGNWRFEGPSFPTIQDLIDHQVQGGTSVTGRSGAILRNMIVRKDWQLKNDDIDLGPRIGKGNFGDVFRGKYRNTEVAVKTCREVLDESVKKKFLKEGQILRQYNHQNIVRFIGIAAQRQPIMIVMEYVPGGSLLNFLKEKGSKQTTAQLVSMCVDASAGMSYLESRNCIHRDLAARNCLVGEDNIVKIADFGMSREEEVYIISEGCKQIPIKWTAPEALELAQYTSKCDVWSFGVLMWEVFAEGETPYKGMNNNQAKSQIMDGYRMPQSPGTPDEIYQLMLRCWNDKDTERPNFDTVHGELVQFHSRL